MPVSRRGGRFARGARGAQAEMTGDRAERDKALADEPDVQVKILQNAPVAGEVAPAGQVYSGQVVTTKATYASDLIEQGVAEANSDEDQESLDSADPSKLETESVEEEKQEEFSMDADKAEAKAGRSEKAEASAKGEPQQNDQRKINERV